MRSQNQSPEGLAEEDKANQDSIRGELLGAVSQKRGKALALTLNTILESVNYYGGKPEPVAEQIASQIAAVFDELPVEKQKEMLESRWDLIRGPAFLPIVRKYARQYREFTVPNEVNAYNSLHLSGAALLRWYELEPNEARTVIIQEITRPRPRYTANVLGILPEETLPEVEQLLAEHFVKEQNSYAAENLASLLQRYATDAVFPQVLAVVDQNVGKWACAIQAPVLAYLLRVNPEVAKPRIEAAMSARGEGYSACNRSLLMELGAFQHDPLLEQIAARNLDDDDPEVAANAATFLGKYGSPSVEESLWNHLIAWNEKWRGREEEFRYVPGEKNPNLWHGHVGSNLILALATAKSWLADAVKLRRLRELAIDSNSKQQVDRMIADWEKTPWTISYHRAGARQYFQVLQYETDSLKSLEEKLKQFAKGSSFTWAGNGPAQEDENKILEEVSTFLASQGMKLRDPAR